MAKKKKQPKRPLVGWKVIQNVVHPHGGISCSHKKEESTDTHCNVDASGRSFAHSKRPDTKGHIVYDSIYTAATAAAKSLQSFPTLCDPIDGSPPGSTVPGILQARTLEWVAISFSSAWKWKVKVKSLHHVQLLVAPWTTAHQAPPSMGFSRQEYWSGVPLPSPHIW